MSGVITGAFDHVEKSVATTDDASTAPAGTLDVEHLAFEERLRLFYTMDGGTFSGDGDWHYLTHYGGARHAFDLSPDARLFVGGTATVRVNGDSWSTANYNAVGGFANLQWSRGTSTLRAGTRVDATTLRRRGRARPERAQRVRQRAAELSDPHHSRRRDHVGSEAFHERRARDGGAARHGRGRDRRPGRPPGSLVAPPATGAETAGRAAATRLTPERSWRCGDSRCPRRPRRTTRPGN